MQNSVGGRIVADAGPLRVDLPHGNDSDVACMYVCIYVHLDNVSRVTKLIPICVYECMNVFMYAFR